MAELLIADPAGERGLWLELRRSGVTATDIAVILGLVSWDSPFALYHRKRGTLPEVEGSDRMRLGSWLESSIAEKFRSDLGIGFDNFKPGGLLASTDRPWQMATPDRLVIGDESPEPLECKSASSRDGWGMGSDLPHADHSPDVTWTTTPGRESLCAACDANTIPAHVRAQVLWQMDVLGVASGHVAVVFVPSGEFRSYTIEHNGRCEYRDWIPGQDVDQCTACTDIDAMRAAGLEFYRRLQGELPPPPLDHLPVTTAALKHLQAELTIGKRTEIPGDLAEDYYHFCELARLAEKGKAETANKVRAAMGDAQWAVYGGEPVARREVFKRTARKTVTAGDVLGEVDRLVPVRPKGDTTDE